MKNNRYYVLHIQLDLDGRLKIDTIGMYNRKEALIQTIDRTFIEKRFQQRSNRKPEPKGTPILSIRY